MGRKMLCDAVALNMLYVMLKPAGPVCNFRYRYCYYLKKKV
jgi:sulfatase maturation enzyme AslB (radical SAM superfamily)